MPIDFRSLIWRINKLHLLHRIFIQRAGAEHGLFMGQMPILEYIREHDRCTQADLAEWLQVSPPSIATSVKRMQRAGLLTKCRNESDCRANQISLTEKGLETVRKCRASFDRLDERIFRGFSEEECGMLSSYLDRLTENLITDEFRDKTFFAMLDMWKSETTQGKNGEGEKNL